MHLYELAWSPSALGACHALDVPLVWGNLVGGMADLLIGDRTAAEELSEKIRPAWTGFARSGDPGWPAYEPSRRLTRILDTTCAVAPYPEETSRALWADHTFAALWADHTFAALSLTS
ncbi:MULTISPECIES: hypothetical protein [unclassified Spirillospora]|uniref:hypothetical protein n=1 Tax=unclassified Spirillospora TaxID=2642701 RepID=UPI00372151B1